MAQAALDALRRDGQVPRHLADAGWLVPLVAARLAERGQARVLDFGGGAGLTWLALDTSLASPLGLEYEIIEGEAVCGLGERLYQARRPRFLSSLPDPDTTYDVVHVRSALQYVTDYEAMLRRLAAYGAPLMLLARLSAGPNRTFATVQINHPGSGIPYWFLNVDEVLAILGRAGYSLVARTADPERLRLPRLPSNLQVRHTITLLLARVDTTSDTLRAATAALDTPGPRHG